MAAERVEPEEVAVSDDMNLWRGALIVSGVLLLAIGGLTFLSEVKPATYLGVGAWLAGAIIVHDGIGAMAVFAATVVIRRFDRVPFAVLAIVQAAAVVTVIVTVVVLPEIVKQAIGSANPTILPLDYVGNLVLVYVGIAVATVVAIAVALVRRPSSSRRTN
ncbi:MAG: hypothetical protein ABI566_04465 [Pseudolysinimonas sp.]